jgi:O-acetyl-ADP-ribose deacetylase (regulator of RNase III)
MSNKNSSEKILLDKAAQLPHEISPERDLWQGIERAIHNKPQDDYSPTSAAFKTNVFKATVVNIINLNAKAPLAWAATVIVAVLLSWMTFSPQKTTNSQLDIAASMQQHFEQQKQLMLVSLGQPDISKLSDDMQAQFTQLKSAKMAINQALENDPNNTSLLNLLRWTQQQELDLLKQLYTPKWQSI